MPSSSITVHDLDPAVENRLRLRATEHGHSVEAEVRLILETALATLPASGADLYERIQARFAPFGGVDPDLPPREPAREPPGFA